MTTLPMFMREQNVVEKDGRATFFFFKWLSDMSSRGVVIANYLAYGLAAARPAAPASGTEISIWYSTDTDSLDVWTGAAWVSGVNLDMVYPAAGIPVSTGTAWNSSKTVPSGTIVGTSDTQTLTAKTLTTPVLSATAPSATRQLGVDASGYLAWYFGGAATRVILATAGGINGDGTTVDYAATPPYDVGALGLRGTPVQSRSGTFNLSINEYSNFINISATASTVTLTPNGTEALPIGFWCKVHSGGNYTTAITRGSGVSAYKSGSNTDADGTVAIRGVAVLTKTGTNTWVMENVT